MTAVGGAVWIVREVPAHHQHSQLILPLRGAKKVLESFSPEIRHPWTDRLHRSALPRFNLSVPLCRVTFFGSRPNISRLSTVNPSLRRWTTSVVFMSLFYGNELLRSCWNASGGNLVHEQGVCSHCGKIFFMSETEHTCSCLCHPLFSRQKIPKKSHSRSSYLADSASDH